MIDKIKLALILGGLGIILFAFIYASTFDCKQANPNNPKACESMLWFLFTMICFPAGVLFLQALVLPLKKQNSEMVK